MSGHDDNGFHPASQEKAFSRGIIARIDTGFREVFDAFLREKSDPYPYGEKAAVYLSVELDRWIDSLWPLCIRPLMPGLSEGDAYLQAAVAAADAAYFGCLKESALRYAKNQEIPALLQAVDRIEAAGVPVRSAYLADEWIEFSRLRNPWPLQHSWDALKYPNFLPCNYWLPRPCQFRKALVDVLNLALKSEARTVSTWGIFARMYPTNRKAGSLWIAEELQRFAVKAAERGITIRKIPSVFAVFLGEEAAQAILKPEVRGFYFTDLEYADQAAKAVDRLGLPPHTTLIGLLAEHIHGVWARTRAEDDYSYLKALKALVRLFSDTGTDLGLLARDPSYPRFLELVVLPGGWRSRLNEDKERARWWLPARWWRERSYSPVADEEGLPVLLGLFAPVLPRGFGGAPDEFFLCLEREKLLEKAPVNLIKALGRALTPEQKKRITLQAPQVWRRLFKSDDPVFREGGWRLILAARNREAKEWLCESLSQEKDSSVYLRFAVLNLDPCERSLAWLEWPDLEQRFIGDYYGMPLWKKAGGLALESDPAGALCRAWGSAGYHGRVSDLEGALAQGLADERLLGLMATKTGLARSHGRLLRTLLEAGRFFEPEGVLSIPAALKAMEHLRRQGCDEAVRAKARGRILGLLPSAESLAKAREFLAGDEGWSGAPLRSAEDLPLLFGEFRRDPVALAAALSKVKFPEADVKAALLAYVKTLQAAKVPYMVQASFGLFAGLWPDPNAGLVKWLVSAIDWKKARGDRLSKSYRTFKIPKKHGGQRQISAPVVPLKRLQHSVLRCLLDPLGSHPAAMGFVVGRSILTNASVHAGRSVVAVTDVHNCFPSVKWPVLYRVLERDLGEKLGLPAVALLADLCTLDGGLPMGSPASPALLNRVLFKADEILAAEAEKRGCAYTRYADDLTFSGDDRAVELVGRARSVLGAAGLVLDPAKTNIFRRGRRQMVTGLVVNEKADVPKFYRRLVRAAVDKYCRGGTPFWEGRPMTLPELLGRVAFVKGVHPGTGEKLLARIREEQKRREAEAPAAQEFQERISK